MANNLLPVVATLFLFLLQFSLTTADTNSNLVLDTNGNPLLAGSEYFVQPATGFFRRIGRAGRSSASSCPQYPIVFNRGDPVKFKPINETRKEIHLSSDLHIDSGTGPCRDDGFWRLNRDAIYRRLVVEASGASDVPPTSFKIDKAPGLVNTYRITTAEAEQQGSSYLSVYCDPASWLKMLAPTDNPSQALLVYFSKTNRDVVATN